jgi:hypothetical protein
MGDLDDRKLVEGLTGEQTIYKRRGEEEPMPGGMQVWRCVCTCLCQCLQDHPKYVRFVLDVSGSMYRFNGTDQRLQRTMEVWVCG